MTTQYGDRTETFMGTGCKDNKGREIGYVVVFRDNGEDFRAYVQNARRIKGEWAEFGVPQRSKSFENQDSATRWAYATAHERIAKIRTA